MNLWRWLVNIFKPQPVGGITKSVALMYLHEAMRIHQYWINHPELYQKDTSDVANLENDMKWVRRYKAIIDFVKAQTR